MMDPILLSKCFACPASVCSETKWRADAVIQRGHCNLVQVRLTHQSACPRCTRKTDGLAAKLARCGIASEAPPQRNEPQRGQLTRHKHFVMAICAKAFWPPKSPETTPNHKFSRNPALPRQSTKKSTRDIRASYIKQQSVACAEVSFNPVSSLHWIALDFSWVFPNFPESLWICPNSSKSSDSRNHQRRKSTPNKKVHLNKSLWTISVALLTCVTGKKTKIRVNFSKKVGVNAAFFSVFRDFGWVWDHSFPLENTKSPHPENPGKLLKNYNLAHSGTVLKITEKLPPKIPKV